MTISLADPSTKKKQKNCKILLIQGKPDCVFIPTLLVIQVNSDLIYYKSKFK